MYWEQILLQINQETVDLLQTFGILAGVAISVVVLIIEHRKNKQALGYSTYVQSALSFAELEKLMMEKEELMQIYWGNMYSKAQSDIDREKEKHKIYHWYYQFFTIIEVVFYAERKGLLEEGQWDGWESTVDNFIELDKDRFVWAWVDSRQNYSEKFRTDIDSRTPCLFCNELISEHDPSEGKWDVLSCKKCEHKCDYRH